MMIDTPTIRIMLGTAGIALLLLVWVYMAARLGTWGVARSWFEFKNKRKGTKNDKRKDIC